MGQLHDKLQAACWQESWNKYPVTRRLIWHTPNELTRLPGETSHQHMVRITQARAKGVVPGVWDLLFYWRGCLHLIEIKVAGKDQVREDQEKFAAQVEAQGGWRHELWIRDEAELPGKVAEFLALVDKIISSP